jgi:RNA polymerase sigma-B factor
VSARRRGSFPTEADLRANDLIGALAAMPAAHADRPELRLRTIEAWLPMANRLANRYAGRGEGRDDLQQTAMIGLIKAVDRFDQERGTDFVSFAVPTILGEIKRYFRDRTWSVRVPRRLQEMRLAINNANTVLSQTLNRQPTLADIARHLGTSEEEVVEGLEGGRAFRAASLSAPVTADGTVELIDTLGSDEQGYDLVEMQLDLGPAIARLSERERNILAMRFWGNQTQTQIAEKIGVSQMHVSRILSATLAKLRSDFDCCPAAGDVRHEPAERPTAGCTR